MDNIIQYLTYDTFRYISRGFYEKHKFLYALVLSFKVDLNRKIISQAEINYILKVISFGVIDDWNICYSIHLALIDAEFNLNEVREFWMELHVGNTWQVSES